MQTTTDHPFASGPIGLATGLSGGVAGGLLLHAIDRRRASRLTATALSLGGAALVGSLCWQACERFQRLRKREGAGHDSAGWLDLTVGDLLPRRARAAARRNQLIMRAMISASLQGDELDELEPYRLQHMLDELALNPADRAVLFEELSSPLGVAELALAAGSQAARLSAYGAALLAVDYDAPGSTGFLQRLADALNLPAGLVREIVQVTSAHLNGQAATAA